MYYIWIYFKMFKMFYQRIIYFWKVIICVYNQLIIIFKGLFYCFEELLNVYLYYFLFLKSKKFIDSEKILLWLKWMKIYVII